MNRTFACAIRRADKRNKAIYICRLAWAVFRWSMAALWLAPIFVYLFSHLCFHHLSALGAHCLELLGGPFLPSCLDLYWIVTHGQRTTNLWGFRMGNCSDGPFLDLDYIAMFVNVSCHQILQILALHWHTGQVKKATDWRKLGWQWHLLLHSSWRLEVPSWNPR